MTQPCGPKMGNLWKMPLARPYLGHTSGSTLAQFHQCFAHSPSSYPPCRFALLRGQQSLMFLFFCFRTSHLMEAPSNTGFTFYCSGCAHARSVSARVARRVQTGYNMLCGVKTLLNATVMLPFHGSHGMVVQVAYKRIHRHGRWPGRT